MQAEIRRAFGSKAEEAMRVFRCESGLNPRSVGDSELASTKRMQAETGKDYGSSIGIAQIRLLPGRPSREWLLDPYNNIQYARQLYDRQGWQPWTCKKVLGL